ncbi:MAG: hypothetical protein ACK5V3_09780 [Bdellovibrionales bacterium]
MNAQSYPQNPFPSKIGLSTPKSSYQSTSGKEIVVFWGIALLVILLLIFALKSMYKKK